MHHRKIRRNARDKGSRHCPLDTSVGSIDALFLVSPDPIRPPPTLPSAPTQYARVQAIEKERARALSGEDRDGGGHGGGH
jgi:hypothetical protein